MRFSTPLKGIVIREAFPVSGITVHEGSIQTQVEEIPATNRHLLLRPGAEVSIFGKGEHQQPRLAPNLKEGDPKHKKVHLVLVRTAHGEFWYFATCFKAAATAPVAEPA